MPRLLYTLLYTLLLPAILLRLLWRGRQAPAYRQRWAERFGRIANPGFDPARPVVWLHAVSVGETLAALPLLQHLRAQHPEWQWVVTTTTPTGSERVRAALGDSVYHVYSPYDLPWLVGRFLATVRPCLLLVMETELWPNWLAACRQRGIPALLVNARLSARSARGYARLAPLTRPMLQDLTAVLAQQADDGERFLQLGLPRERLQVTGSIKFDVQRDAGVIARAARLREAWTAGGTRPVWLAASTHAGEDEPVLAAFAQLRQQVPGLLLVLVPRHPERFDAVARLAARAGWRVARHSLGDAPAAADIVLGDTMGELLAFYGAADIAFVGGSLVPTGGHNLIEPAVWGCPVATGPYLFNFAEVARLLQQRQALAVVQDSAALAQVLGQWLADPVARAAVGAQAQAVAEANRGALQRVVAQVEAATPALSRRG